ncbi:DUF2779 domain-containing protein [Spiroplasma eriocheiris]|uniref:DUF2779 domain-containing protein n=1 Tax=Spiroplasma eriocheiris TaxID=315358 RepID=A0A0H3XI04_9MOLU|nr:DUF2779 domain-containing protein [Spiroplasma eriocheiris]AHF57605.1 hypothetical protein SPE_0477 [Spiroplasma eriocheiris CCTCC M 207170]AKM54060.1 hypothetical protein SERIO_v1c04830 [Spiroplasma eriocheiris]
MDAKLTLKKEDYKRFKKCFKLSWALANRANLKQVQTWVSEQQLSVFFDLKDNIHGAKIDEDNFLNDENEDEENNNINILNENLYDLMLETSWPAGEGEDDFDTQKLINYYDDLNQLIDPEEIIEFYPGETIADGNEVGARAREYFTRDYKCFNLDHYSKKNAFAKTQEVLQDQSYQVYFEPSFEYNNCITKCDILKRLDDGSFHLIEVKASTGKKYDKNYGEYVEKDLKIDHAYDIAYQYYVLTGCGLRISKISVMLLDPSYYRHGDIDYDRLFMLQDHFKQPSKRMAGVSLMTFAQQLTTGEITDPQLKNERAIELDLVAIKLGYQKSLTEIYDLFMSASCWNQKPDDHFRYYGYCQHASALLPEHNSVFELYRGMGKKTLLLYEENIIMLKDIHLPFNFKRSAILKKPLQFNEPQIRQIKVLQDLEPIINPHRVDELLQIFRQYQYPIYMYDFETMKAAVPRFDYSYSYQQIPFQYSVHVLTDDNFDYQDENTMDHYAYLADGLEDPRLTLATQLIADLTKNGMGVYVAYYKSFECKVLFELGDYLNWKISTTDDIALKQQYQYLQTKLLEIRAKTIDLMDFFKDFMIYKPEFYGSKSIKKTQPAFDPQFTYQELKIRKGDMASETFRRRVENNITLPIWLKYFRSAMLKYCNRDTLAMVVIFQHIKQLLHLHHYL